MSKINVDSIFKSVLKESATNKKELATNIHTLLSNSLNDVPEEHINDHAYHYTRLFLTLTEVIIDREMEIYKNVSTTLQRVIDEIQANEDSV